MALLRDPLTLVCNWLRPLCFPFTAYFKNLIGIDYIKLESAARNDAVFLVKEIREKSKVFIEICHRRCVR